MTDSPDLLAVAQSAYAENMPNFAKYLKQLFARYPRGQSEVRAKIDSDEWLRGTFICDFIEEPPWHPDRYIDGDTGDRPVHVTIAKGNTLVRIENFAWDHIVLATKSEPPSLSYWFDKWFQRPRPFDVEGVRASGCIHSVMKPHSFRDYFVTRIDLGTAKPQAFIDLIETCERADVPRLVINSGYGADWSAF